MGLVILQEKLHPTGKGQAVPRDGIRVTLTRPTAHEKCRAKATLRVTFGTDTKHAEFYCIGVDSGRLVLVPTDNSTTGYKVSDKNGCNRLLRIDLTDTVLSLFSRGILDLLKDRPQYELKGNLDKDYYVWIDGNK